MKVNNSPNIMIDIETLGLKPGSGIWQIGAVVLGRPDLTFNETINPWRLVGVPGISPDTNTISWQLLSNSENFQAACKLAVVANERQLIKSFTDWLTYVKNYYFSNDPINFWQKRNFDEPFLTEAMQRYGVLTPWKYYQWNDLGTLCNFYNSPVPKFEGAHDAFEDAKHQALHLENLINTYLTNHDNC